jgi:hypothetical protein
MKTRLAVMATVAMGIWAANGRAEALFFDGLVDSVKGAFGGVVDKVKGVAQDAVKGVRNSLQGGLSSLGDTVKGLTGRAREAAEGLAKGIVGKLPGVLKGLGGHLAPGKGLLGALKGGIGGLIDKVRGGLLSRLGGSDLGGLASTFKKLLGRSVDLARGLLGGKLARKAGQFRGIWAALWRAAGGKAPRRRDENSEIAFRIRLKRAAQRLLAAVASAGLEAEAKASAEALTEKIRKTASTIQQAVTAARGKARHGLKAAHVDGTLSSAQDHARTLVSAAKDLDAAVKADATKLGSGAALVIEESARYAQRVRLEAGRLLLGVRRLARAAAGRSMPKGATHAKASKDAPPMAKPDVVEKKLPDSAVAKVTGESTAKIRADEAKEPPASLPKDDAAAKKQVEKGAGEEPKASDAKGETSTPAKSEPEKAAGTSE